MIGHGCLGGPLNGCCLRMRAIMRMPRRMHGHATARVDPYLEPAEGALRDASALWPGAFWPFDRVYDIGRGSSGPYYHCRPP